MHRLSRLKASVQVFGLLVFFKSIMSIYYKFICNSINRTCTHDIQTFRTLKSWTGGIQYDGFKYFPRNPEEKDPPFDPPKLFMVQRIKPFKGNDYRLKRILVDLKLDGKKSEIAIVKNIPETISRLYKIKHLIKITPIRTPDGLPEDGDLSCGYLKENGEFVVSKKLRVDQNRLNATNNFLSEPDRLDSDTLIKQSRLQWLNPW